jgi:predicted permease
MLLNHLRIAFRHLLSNRFFSAINITGLALGMSCTLLIWLWVKDEINYDRFLPGLEKIYAVRINQVETAGISTSTYTTGPLADALKKEVPEIAYAVKVQNPEDRLIRANGKTTKESGFYATKDFFGVFPFTPAYGNPATALANLNQVVLTRRTAEKFFGTADVLGEQLQFNNDQYYTVGAVVENLPANATLRFDWMINYDVQEADWKKHWGNTFCMTYVRLSPRVSQAKAEANTKEIYPRNTDWEHARNVVPVLQPMRDVHLYSKYENGRATGGRIEYVYIFSAIAGFILLIACINFMNLATARSATRAREVGVRKVVGALRSTLVGQFLTESVLTSLLAVGVALLLTSLALPAFNAAFDKQLVLDLSEPVLWLSIVVLVAVTGLVSGSYPALFLSALQPIRILKGVLRFGAGASRFRRVLVVFQFVLSIFLIIGMLVVARQMHYIQTKNLGLDRENIVYVPIEGELDEPKRMETFRQELLRRPSIASATVTMSLPQNIQSSSSDLNWPGRDPKKDNNASAMAIGYDFVKTMGIKLVDGRDFSKDRVTDTSAYLINESAARMMGMKDPVGREITFWHGKGPIVGVMKDFHLQSLHQPITPLVLTLQPGNTSYLLVRTQAGETPRALADLELLTKQFNPNYPFGYHFADEEYDRMYRSEQQVSLLINYFGVLAIVISCLGLFGLAAFTAQQRTKEIGIRKVLGASVVSIVSLLSKDFLKLVLIALVLAVPVAGWALHKWLDSFQYSIRLDWWIYAVAGALAAGIALLTISFQSLKAALANPVRSLRSE